MRGRILLDEAIIFAIVSSIFFSIGNNLSRVGVLRGDPAAGTALSVFIGTPLLFAASILTGRLGEVVQLDWASVTYLAFAGMIHFVGGRGMQFFSSKIIGVGRSLSVMNSSSVYTVLLGLTLLGEKLALKDFAGIALMLLGNTAISLSGSGKDRPLGEGRFKVGLSIALLGAVFWGISPILISLGLSGRISPATGSLVSYLFAAMVWAAVILPTGRLASLKGDRRTVVMFLMSGLVVAMAQLSRYSAIAAGKVVLVTPVSMSLTPVLTVLLAYLFLQRIERINLQVWVATGLVVAGTLVVTGL